MKGKSGQWTLPAILGVAGVLLIILPLSGNMHWLWLPLGVVFLLIAIGVYANG